MDWAILFYRVVGVGLTAFDIKSAYLQHEYLCVFFLL